MYTSYLTQKDVDLLNSKVANKLPISNNFSLIIVIKSM